MNCIAVREVSLAAFEFGIEYRLLLVIIYVTGINVLLRHMQTKVVPRFKVYGRLAPEVTEEIAVRCMQLCIAPVVATGYAFLIFSAATGCDATEIFLLYLGGGLLNAADLHEWIRRWPLRMSLLAHHVMVFGITLCFTDFRVLPAQRGQPVDVTTVVLICNIGLCWATDFFHVIFRTSNSLQTIERAQTAYLCLAVIRVCNIGLLAASSVRAGLSQSWVGMAFAILMDLAYIYNTQRALRFVWHFDCAMYFDSHQARWAREEASDEVKDGSSGKSTKSLKRSLSGAIGFETEPQSARRATPDELSEYSLLGNRGDTFVGKELAQFRRQRSAMKSSWASAVRELEPASPPGASPTGGEGTRHGGPTAYA